MGSNELRPRVDKNRVCLADAMTADILLALLTSDWRVAITQMRVSECGQIQCSRTTYLAACRPESTATVISLRTWFEVPVSMTLSHFPSTLAVSRRGEGKFGSLMRNSTTCAGSSEGDFETLCVLGLGFGLELALVLALVFFSVGLLLAMVCVY